MTDDDEYGAVDGIIGKGNRSTWIKRVPVLLCPQIPHDLTRTPTHTAAVGSHDKPPELWHGQLLR
jgi:hypothetical protein